MGHFLGCADDDETILLTQEKFGRREKVPRVENCAENVVPRQTFDDFKSHFRLGRGTFDMLVNELSGCQEFQTAGYGRPPVTVAKQTMVFLWYLGTPESFRSIADRFDISKSTAHGICHRVSHAITRNLMQRTIQWPSRERCLIISEGFAQNC